MKSKNIAACMLCALMVMTMMGAGAFGQTSKLEKNVGNLLEQYMARDKDTSEVAISSNKPMGWWTKEFIQKVVLPANPQLQKYSPNLKEIHPSTPMYFPGEQVIIGDGGLEAKAQEFFERANNSDYWKGESEIQKQIAGNLTQKIDSLKVEQELLKIWAWRLKKEADDPAYPVLVGILAVLLIVASYSAWRYRSDWKAALKMAVEAKQQKENTIKPGPKKRLL